MTCLVVDDSLWRLERESDILMKEVIIRIKMKIKGEWDNKIFQFSFDSGSCVLNLHFAYTF